MGKTQSRAIMVQGTMSNAGKSLLVAGLCRVFAQDGYRVAPFKSQNMALNSFVGDDGLELGRAQAMQAEAAGIAPDVRMNPILLKPTDNEGSQVIVKGRPIGNMSARNYFAYKHKLKDMIVETFNDLALENDIIVIEGAGSPAEINLKNDDIVNMGMARMASAPVLLAGDIDPGGVFAQLYGTLELLESDEREMVKGLIVNKFRGDPTILKPGIALLEELCNMPVVGVVPYMELDLDDEDSLAPRLRSCGAASTIDIAVIHLPHISNFTDFNQLSRRSDMSIRYVSDAPSLGRPDLVIVPGTKNTLDDLRWMHESGIARCVVALAAGSTPVIGICGGYQMLGRHISDPYGVESGGEMEGLGLLPMQTVFEKSKELARTTGVLTISEGIFAPLSGLSVEGYEIHMGTTTGVCSSAVALTARFEANLDGAVSAAATDLTTSANPSKTIIGTDGGVCGNVMGSYIHGIFDAPGIVDALADVLLKARGLPSTADQTVNSEAFKQSQYDKLANTIRASLDMDQIYQIVEKGI